MNGDSKSVRGLEEHTPREHVLEDDRDEHHEEHLAVLLHVESCRATGHGCHLLLLVLGEALTELAWIPRDDAQS